MHDMHDTVRIYAVRTRQAAKADDFPSINFMGGWKQ